jgi:hypothetical protein
LGTTDGAKMRGRRAVLRQEAMYSVRNGVRRRICIHHEHCPTHAAEYQRCAKPCRACTDDDDIGDLDAAVVVALQH